MSRINRYAILFCLVCVGALYAQQFKVGDYIGFSFGGGWMDCKISRPLVNNGYGISCGSSEYTAAPNQLRLRAATAQDKQMDAETDVALARQPHGNTVGGQYGTREPKTCANRIAPAKGAPSIDQVRQYVLCDSEHALGAGLFLVTNVKVQVAPVSHPATDFVRNIHPGDLDSRYPVWDIRGSFTQYLCQKPEAMANNFAKSHNCSVSDYPQATGYCYKNTFGAWHCALDGAGLGDNQRQNALPPEGN